MFNLWIIIISFVLLFSNTLKGETLIKEIAYSKAWLNLLYYQKKGEVYKSLVLNQSFFLSEKGKEKPLEELKEHISLFKKEIPVNENHPQCLFPARYKLLKKKFKLAPKIKCPRLSQWRESYQPESLNIVYASQFIANPASVFGHSFLLIPSKKQVESFWLTYNYAGNIPSNVNAFSYVVGGLLGWYKGDYSVMPFYSRLFHYGSIENRDLWSYKIKLQEEELDFVLDHLWELVHNAKFSYYFLDENCAGMLLRTFAATLEDFYESSDLDFYVHPIEVLKALEKRGRLGELQFIPSQSNQLDFRVKSLNNKEKIKFLNIIKTKNPSLPTNISANTLDALIEYLTYQKHKNEGMLPEEFKELERKTYIARSKLDKKPLAYEEKNKLASAPHISHKSSLISFGLSSLNDDLVSDFSYRFSIHDIMDREAGYIKNSSVEIFHLKLSAKQDKVWLRDLTFVNIENIQPYQKYRSSPSWRFKLAYVENIFSEKLRDQYFLSKGAYGFSKDFSNSSFYVMLASDIQWGKVDLQGDWDLGPELGWLYTKNKWKSRLSLFVGRDILSNAKTNFIKARADIRWAISKNISLIQENEYYDHDNLDKTKYRTGLGLKVHY